LSTARLAKNYDVIEIALDSRTVKSRRQVLKIKQVVMSYASKRPALSVIFPSAVVVTARKLARSARSTALCLSVDRSAMHKLTQWRWRFRE
jgi:hypothetical protein